MLKNTHKKLLSLILIISLIFTSLTLQLSVNADEADYYTVVQELGISGEKSGTGTINITQSGFSADATSAQNPYLRLSVYIAQTDNADSISGFVDGDGQVELSSSGKCDTAEIHWMTSSLGLKAGWNTLYLGFSDAIATDNGEIFDPQNINYFRIYQARNDESISFDLKVKDVAIVTKNSSMELNSIYGDGMLFQQNKPITVSGTADAGHIITASVTDPDGNVISEGSTTVSDDGSWKVTMSGVEGSYTEYDIVFTDNGKTAMSLYDIVFGELWMAAGQSNMAFKVKYSTDADILLANPQEKYIKILYVPDNPASGSPSGEVPYNPQTEIKGAVWSDASDSVILGECSATGYYFAAKLKAELDMPVGILSVAQGATSIYGWLSREAIDGNQTVKEWVTESGRYIDQSNWNQADSKNYKQMTSMYNQKVAPLESFNIAGLIWYQGENEIADDNGTYANALNLLIESYSEKFSFDNGSMPTVFSHLAPYFYGTSIFDKAAEFSGEFSAVWYSHPKTTSQVTVYDLPLEYNTETGDNPIHPMNKKPVGERMANAALGLVYAKYDEYTSPVVSDVTVDGNSLLVKFDHTGDGLAAKAEDDSVSTDDNVTSLSGFAVCGADGIYLPAKAVIVSEDTVKVTNDSIKYPISVTYAYTEMNNASNLVSTSNNSALFAAVPFCTQRIDNEQFYRPIEWLSTEYLKQWRSNGTTAAYYDIWRDGTLNQNSITSVSLSDTVKTDGAYSVKIDFQTTQYWAFGLTPNIFDENSSLFSDIDRSLTKYDTLTFDIKQETGKELKMHIAINSGGWCNPKILGFDSTSSTGAYTHYSLGTTDEWQTVMVDLSNLKAYNSANSTAVVLSAVSNMEFTFGASIGANAKGVIYLDNFRLGFSEDKEEIDKQSVLTAVNTASKINTTVYTKATRTSLVDALTVARDILCTASANQSTADNSYTALQSAIDTLLLIGDCNADGYINAADLTVLRKILLNTYNYNQAADINEDDNINIIDLVKLKKQTSNSQKIS